MARNIFGTDGVRGRANVEPMTAETALALGQAVSVMFRRRGGDRHRIIIGKDTRLSGYMFENALVAGMCSMGVDVLQVGPMPTPGMAFLTVDMRCDAGVMISASHNPYQDNGIKFFSHDGFKLPDEFESRIEELIANGRLEKLRAPAEEVGRAQRIEDATGRYVVFLKKTFPLEQTLEGLRIVLDCANGAAYKVGPTVLSELDAEVFTLGVTPNGRNINDGVGSVHPETVQAKVKELRADVGIALDGDGDRCQLVDEKGNLVDGDAILAITARDMVERGVLRGGAVVGTVMSNLGLERAVERLGLRLVRTAVGDRYVVEEMRSGGYNLGGEQSGHLVFLDHNTTGDGLITALQALAILRRSERPLSELVSGIERFPQVLLNVRVAEKRPLEGLPAVRESVARVEKALDGRGRVLIRYSGTEPKARVMVEGEDEARVRDWAEEIAGALRRALDSGAED
jgi:phosphoglucosamine mutase